MPRKRWRSFVLACGAVFALIGAVSLAVEIVTRDGPNYSRIEGGLYQGGNVSSPPWRTRAVLNLCETPDPYTCEVYVWEPIRDAAPAPSVAWLRERVEWIDAQRQAGHRVFVHCHAGNSRSGMVVVAYLMYKNRWARDEALAFVRTRRPSTRPNPAFMDLLAEWERVVLGR
jgi:hypothetical protein